MIGVIAKLAIKEGKTGDAIKLIKELMTSVAEEEGTLSYTMNQDKADPNTIVIMERYKDKAALEYHSSTPGFKAFFEKIGGLLAGKPEISVMEEIHSI
jgi:quinol monooxygenase YgiN